MSLSYWDRTYANWLFQYVVEQGANEYGAAGLLGNLHAESGICPYRQQNMSYEASLRLTTEVFRHLSEDDFVYYDGNTGYSLPQWTTYDRRRNYYRFIGGARYLGDSLKSAYFLVHELKTDYPGVWNKLVNATSVEDASDYVLVYYEAPAELDYEGRRSRSRQVYQDFVGTPPVPPPTPIGGTLPPWLIKMINDNEI